MDDLIRNLKDLKVYKVSFDLAMEIFELTRKFPKEEIYSLTDQILRSSRAVTSNIAEAYGRRKYSKSFIFSLTISESEIYETITWCIFSAKCGYITNQKEKELITGYEYVLRMISKMIRNPDKWS
jgi:four helix bundle protein